MRNLFDQYDQPENRLSHALAVCLDEDRRLLKNFLGWMGVEAPRHAGRLHVVEQSLPGDAPESEELAERRGLPDIVIHDDAAWCVLIESKVQAALTHDQLTRHDRTLRRRGFREVQRVVLTKRGARAPKAIALTWSGLYQWLGTGRARSDWAERLRSYLRAAEVRLARADYLTEGTLTMFDGFQFTEDNPYTYGEGKRLLKLAIAELRRDRTLKALGMDPKAPGRSAITGRSEKAVWDFLSLRDRPNRGAFTSYPHLTLAIKPDHLEAAITIPNSVTRIVRKQLAELGPDGLVTLNAAIVKQARRILVRGGWVDAYAVQRHYRSQRASAVTDARVFFKLETSQPGGAGPVKHRPEWTQLFADLLGRKRANIQFGYVVNLPWEMKGMDSRDSLRLIVDSWSAMRPLLRAVRGRPIR